MQLISFERLDPETAEPDHSMGAQTFHYDAFESTTPGGLRVGAIVPLGGHAGSVVDLNRALAVKLALDDAGAPEAEADSLLPPDMLELLRRGRRSLDAARSALAFTLDAIDRYDGPDLMRAGVVEERRHVRVHAPVPRPGKIIGVARNYPGHAAERGDEPPGEPTLFLKASSAVIGPEDELVLPRASQQVDYEGELAVVVGARARDLEPREALDCVAGYCVANDVTARDYQHARGQRFIGKSCDGFAPLGPALVTRDEVPDPQALSIRTLLSGEVVQSGSTKEMVFPVAELLAFASRLMTLEPGDVLLTGTPAGVGAAQDPPRWLRDGDLMEVAIESVGRLRTYVRGRA